jgi:hypothetical protein
MKYLKTFENMDSIIRDFNKSTYSPEDKSIIAAYMITSENDKSIEILNIKETERRGVFLDNAIGYDITIHRTNLDKSQIEILEDVSGMQGFKYIRIPYYLYKSNLNVLEVKRFKGGFDGEKYKKRLNIPAIKTEDSSFISEFKDHNVVNYIKITNPDERTHFLLGLYVK